MRKIQNKNGTYWQALNKGNSPLPGRYNTSIEAARAVNIHLMKKKYRLPGKSDIYIPNPNIPNPHGKVKQYTLKKNTS